MTELFLYQEPLSNCNQDLLYHALERYLGKPADRTDWRTEVESRGKPYFATHSELHYSLSDSHGVTLIAFSDDRIGADLQMHRSRSDEPLTRTARRATRIAARAFSPAERNFAEAAAAEPARMITRFYRIWTAKEAYVKYTGAGIDSSFAAHDILPAHPDVRAALDACPDTSMPLFTDKEKPLHIASWRACDSSFSLYGFHQCTLCLCKKSSERQVRFHFLSFS